MERRTFQTPLGEVWLWGRWTDAGQRVLVIRGVNADPESFHPLADMFPEADFVFGHIPGYHSPLLAVQTVGAMAAAYSRVLDRPSLLVGHSLGATVALAIRSPLVRSILAIEPVLSTGDAWPVAELLKPRDDAERELLWSVFGIRPGEHVNRDYSVVLDGLRAPAWVLASADPLGRPRALPRMPSLLPERDRRLLKAHPLIRFSEVAGAGHDIGTGAPNVIANAVRVLLGAHEQDDSLAGPSASRATAGSTAG